jgi:conjugative transposon TraK protein
MFDEMRHIDRAFRHIRLFASVFILCCAGLTGAVSWYAIRMIHQATARVYVLDGGEIREARASERADVLGIEARDHIRTFHSYFFNLDPDKPAILLSMDHANNLADACARQQYERFEEQHYYNDMIAGNVSQRITWDTVTVNTQQYPYYFRYRMNLTITRPSVITLRYMETEGWLRAVGRSDNNPHGFLIERWQILDSRDMRSAPRPHNP